MFSVKKRILSVCGGGVWGVGAASFLSQLSRIQEPVDMFTHFAGTSTGAIIAACLAKGMKADDIRKLFDENVSRIFTKKPWYKRFLPGVPTYESKYFKAVLKEVFGDMTMEMLEHPCYLVAWRTTGGNRNKVFGPYSDAPVWLAVMASSAAPTYFETVLHKDHEYMDGGLWANNPGLCAMAGISREVEDLSDVHMVTLSTSGGAKHGRKVGNIMLIKLAKYLLGTILTARSSGTEYIARELLCERGTRSGSRHLSVIPDTNEEIELDDLDRLKDIRYIWHRTYTQYETEILAWYKQAIQ